jgi:hypothetical protein
MICSGMKHTLWILVAVLLSLCVSAQRTYRENSVLGTGTWYRLTTGQPGMYKIDLPFLNKLGITGSVPSASIRLFGNGGAMLPENNADPRPDDLVETAIEIVDGGDGQLNGDDYFLFYAGGVDEWIPDRANKRFRHKKNLYARREVFFLTIGGQGLRIGPAGTVGPTTVEVGQGDERFFIEKDSLNFLASGKEWYGDEFSAIPGRLQRRTYSFPVPGLVSSAPVQVVSDVIARSVGQPATFDVLLNQSILYQHILPPLQGATYDPIATASVLSGTRSVSTDPLQVELVYTPGSVNAQGWLNWLEIFCRRNLSLETTGSLLFRDWNSVGTGQIAGFTLVAPDTGLRVWEITNPQVPVSMPLERSGNLFRFRNDCSILREYIACREIGLLTPLPEGRIPNQNLHQATTPALIILTTAALMPEAGRLASHHREQDRLTSVVADVAQVYNEFSSGKPDPVAIRDFVKMFYDRAGADTARRPRYLLLFGDASYDYLDRIPDNTNLVPAWQSTFSLDPLTTHTSDDFFGLLDDGDDVNRLVPVSLLDIGIGRIPAATPEEARAVVDKIIRYRSPESYGPWRNQLSFVADDEDQNLHLNDAEFHTETLNGLAPEWNISKTYLDAFRQESGAGGSRYPQVNESINTRIFNGTLIWNYSGHGGNRRLAQESILEEEMVANWKNENRLPLFVTATCDFAPYDNPLVKSIGEKIVLRDRTGGIALMTTTRLVFAFSNRVINNNYLRIALGRQPDGHYLSLGDAVRQAKNFTYQTSGDIINNRKFVLIGDPALTLGFPQGGVRTTSVNGNPVGTQPDTLRALNRYTLTGEVTDENGLVLSDFNGYVYPVIYDKPQQVTTLANDPGSQAVAFKVQSNLIYKGKVRAVNGKFSTTFIVPRDINYQFGNGRISYYASEGSRDGQGLYTGVVIGGAGDGVQDDGEGPVIKAYLNDEKFVNGSVTNETPVLILKIADSSGINTVGTGIGHDLTAVLDGDMRNTFVLNDFYETDADSYQRGTVRFQLPGMQEGMHQLLIRVWDVFNNFSEHILDFKVVRKENLTLNHVLNYPNPFTSRTQFWFEHNRPGEDLQVTVQIMTITGKQVKTIAKTIKTAGNRSMEIDWDGRDDYGSKLGRGVYLYRLKVRTADGKSQERLEKMLIL